MSLRPSLWLIEICVAFRPAGRFLHMFEDGSFLWAPDKTRALRFKTKCEAEHFGRNRLTHDFVAAEQARDALLPPSDLGRRGGGPSGRHGLCGIAELQ